MNKISTALLCAFAAASEPNPPTWDSTSVKFCDPANFSACQGEVNAIWFENGGKTPECNG
jgi:hypothetical protein